MSVYFYDSKTTQKKITLLLIVFQIFFFFFLTFCNREITVYTAVSVNDQISLFIYINTTVLKTKSILGSSDSPVKIFYIGNSQLFYECLNRACEEGEFVRQEMFICPGIPSLKV